jgi:hypothetical protein
LRTDVITPKFKRMSILETAEELLAKMSRAEKAQVLQ